MSIIAAYMVPHPPMIVPEVGRGSERQVAATRAAYERVAEDIAALRPETVIISSPHATMYADYFHLSPDGKRKDPLPGSGHPRCVSGRNTTRSW